MYLFNGGCDIFVFVFVLCLFVFSGVCSVRVFVGVLLVLCCYFCCYLEWFLLSYFLFMLKHIVVRKLGIHGLLS